MPLMNKKILIYLFYIIIWTAVFFLNWFFLDFAPHPWHHVSPAFTAMILYVIITPGRSHMWIVLLLIWLQELIAATPFGMNALALFIGLSALNWCLLTIFANRSLLILCLATFLTVAIYRVSFYFFLKTGVVLFNQTFNYSWVELGKDMLWEMLFTSTLVIVLYLLLSFFLKGLKPEYITAHQVEYDSKRYFY